MVRLVRSKGVGVYFVTQNPLDIPDSVLAQLGNRVQHALRAYTPRDQKAVKATAQTMRQKPGLDIEAAITELAVGEALINLLDVKDRPSLTERAYVLPPGSQIGPITAQQRQALLQNSLVADAYEKDMDRDSVCEKLKGRANAAIGEAAQASRAERQVRPRLAAFWADLTMCCLAAPDRAVARTTVWRKSMAKSAMRTMGGAVGREIIRGVPGGLFSGKK